MEGRPASLPLNARVSPTLAWPRAGVEFRDDGWDSRAPQLEPEGPPSVIILGCRGIPASYGGFETFAERLALHLNDHGWDVTVACQTEEARPSDIWRGIRRVFHAGVGRGELASIIFDARSVVAATRAAIGSGRDQPVILTLGYNTAVFGLLFRMLGIPNVVNMDGVEWRRKKWSRPVQAWFWANERMGALLADHMVADHPAIATHLSRHSPSNKLSVIPYGAHPVVDAPTSPITALGLNPGGYALVVARPVPENSILEIVTAYSSKPRDYRLVALGDYHPDQNGYHAAVIQAAGPGVIFPGAIYDRDTLEALRFNARLYVHGHTVGGTNPSLVEALGSGMAVLAHDNVYNRWVAGPEMRYFSDTQSCAEAMDDLLTSSSAPENVLAAMRAAARERFIETFTWPMVLDAYEKLLLRWVTSARSAAAARRSAAVFSVVQ